MRDLRRVANECMAEQQLLGIDFGYVSVWKVNTRALKRWGQCKRLPNGTFEININVDLLNELNDINGLKDTIHHELLHTVSGCMNHGAKWQALAKKVNSAYGYHIQRTNSAECKGIVARTENYKYQVVCPNCGIISKKSRACGVTKSPWRYGCARCHSKELKVVKL